MSVISTFLLIASVLVLSQPSLQSSASIELTIPSGSVSVNGLAEFACTVTGAAEVYNVTWLYNGTVRSARNTPYTTITTNGKVSVLAIHAIPSEEAGNYTCIVYVLNASTPLQKSIELRLEGPPKVTAELVQYVVRGDDATLICNVSGHPKPSVIWRRNGLVIEDEETMKYSEPVVGLLRINNTTKEDTGIYTCIASNSKGKDELNVTLTVLTFPVIQSQSPVVVSSAGQQTVLHCSATGINTPTISWRTGDMDVGTSNNSRITLHMNGTLVINDAEVLDSGKYLCTAKNKAGSVTNTTTLNVTGRPVLLEPPQNTAVQVGSPARLSCSFLANPNDGEIHWQRRNGNLFVDILPSEEYQILENGTLIITRTVDADSREYQCNVSNSEGQTTAKANLTVINRPNTPKEFEGNGSADTETYTVSWEAPEQSDTARPVSYYVIKLQLVGTEMTIRVPHNQTQYMFTDLLPGNQYNASIAAVNQVGTSNYTALLNFSTLPTVPALESFTVTESDTDEVQLIFAWEIRYDGGHPINNFIIQYQDIQDDSEDTWIDLFTRGLDENAETYKAESLPPQGSYIFRAVIGNILGNNYYNHSAEIDIPKALPGQPSKPEASETTEDSVMLDFNLDFMGTGIVKQFVIKVTGDSEQTQNFPASDTINSSSNVTLTVGGLEADSTYRFQVAAMNDIGIGPFSEMSDEITTEADDTVVYIIVGAVGGFVIIVVILIITLSVCYIWNKRMKAHKHQISINESPENKIKVPVIQDDHVDDSNGFMQPYNKPLPRYTYNSDSTILSPVERSRSLQYRNESFGPAGSTISYGSSIATRTESLLHTKPNNYSMPRGPMYSSATLVSYGSGSQYNMMDNRHWSPPSDFSQRERRSPSSTYHSDGLGKITNMATDV